MTLRRDFEDEARKRGMSVTERVVWAFGLGIVAGMALMDFIHLVIKAYK